ncbi:polysaccharide lyase family 7 protein [Hirschia litorea]|uniref:Polysaccharide lyase family 7 protein n=1 Tax=Hirschia litorea TaxID=1199156 RepID=A0ABW2ILK7_9PROT
MQYKKAFCRSVVAVSAFLFTGQAGYAQENQAPFELIDWYLGLPIDENGDGKSDTISEKKLADGWTDPRFFYYSEDGGITFRAPVHGALTSKNTTYVRTELREMLRRGNTKIKTSQPSKNNWVLSTAPRKARKMAGGVDGELHATLAVNHVTTTGEPHEVGRVIIGQIHGKDDEPVRIYYRKLPENKKGSLYFAHEVKSDGEDRFFNLLGDRANDAADPVDGIALNERFSYTIVAFGNALEVSILQDGKVLVRRRIDMSASGYDAKDEYLYFKAGVYNQNKTGAEDDYVQATFYELTNKHARPR